MRLSSQKQICLARQIRGRLALVMLMVVPLCSGHLAHAEEPGKAPVQEGGQAEGAPLPIFGRDSTPIEEPDTEELPALPGAESEGASVRSGDLDRVGAVPLGLILESQEGFDFTLWQGTSARSAAKMLEALPERFGSRERTSLFRHTLFSPAFAPVGDITPDFLTLRAKAALEGGFVEEAKALLDLQTEPAKDLGTQKIRARLLLLEGKKRSACQIAARTRDEIDDPFWLRLRTYCYIILEDPGAASFSVALMEEQGIDDPLFFALVANLVGDAGIEIDPVKARDEIDLALLEVAGHGFAGEALKQVPPAFAYPARRIPWSDLSKEQRLSARLPYVEKMVAAGRLPVGKLTALYDSVDLADENRAAHLLPRTPQSPLRSAAMVQSFHLAVMPIEQAKLLSLAYKDAATGGDLSLFTLLYGPELQGIPVEPSLDIFALDFAETALASGLIREGGDWLRLARHIAHQSIEDFDRLDDLAVLYSLASTAEGAAPAWDAKARLTKAQGTTKERRALLEVAMHLALGGWIDEDTRRLMMGSNLEDQGALPSREHLARLGAASRGGRKAETVLAVLLVMSDSKSAQISIATLEKCVSALRRAGFSNNAKTLAIESLLEGF